MTAPFGSNLPVGGTTADNGGMVMLAGAFNDQPMAIGGAITAPNTMIGTIFGQGLPDSINFSLTKQS